MDDKTRTELEAAAFRTLVDHLRERADVQNLDLMNLAGFCRNCLSKWYRAAAEEKGLEMSYDTAREIVKRGTSAHRQIAIYDQAIESGAAEQEALKAVVDWLIEETVSGIGK